MAYFKWAFLGVIFLMAATVSSAQQTTVSPAQQKFPLTPGEWVITTPGTTQNQQPTVAPYCLNDELWYKVIRKNPACSITNYSATPAGISYKMSCAANSFQMKGNVNIVFDGMTHMVSQGSFIMEIRGEPSRSDSQIDFRWKGPTCDPYTDVNLKVVTPADSDPEPKPIFRNHVDH